MQVQQVVQLDIQSLRPAQTRAATDEATAEEYAEVLASGEELPPGDAFHDGAVYWLADGHIRRRAHEIAERVTMAFRVHEGGQRAALLFGIKANVKHGLRPDSEDRKRAVNILLTDPEWSAWSDAEIARTVAGCESGAARELVAASREKISCLAGKIKETAPRKIERTSKNGKTTVYTMKPRAAAPPDHGPWVRAALEDGERMREALIHVPNSENALCAADLAISLVRELQEVELAGVAAEEVAAEVFAEEATV